MEDALKQATKQIKSGDEEGGRLRLIELLKTDPTNDTAWVWLATVVDTNELRQECLQEALTHNPRNALAKKALARLQAKPDRPQHEGESPSRRSRQAGQRWRVQPFVVFMVAAGLAMLLLAAGVVRDEWDYQTRSQVVNATAQEFYRSVYQVGDACNLTYRFEANGKTVDGHSEFPCAQWATLQQSKRLQVQYVVGDPSRSRYYPDWRRTSWIVGASC